MGKRAIQNLFGKNLGLYRQRLAKIPEEKIIAVAPEVGVPIAEKLAYVSDQNLSALYLNLLSKASTSDFASQAHPSFVNVINNLCPDEAQLLKCFVTTRDVAFVTAKWTENAEHTFSIAADFLVGKKISGDLLFPANIPAYFSNLEGLGLVRALHNEEVAETSIYTQLESLWAPNFPADTAPEPGKKLEFAKGIIALTEFGKLFIADCGNGQ